jgi:creatinine amidohydrolase/Fe(II)-dependent formamide hydrolase-like protein
VGAIFGSGVHSVAANGVIGDPAQASPDHGARYWEKVTAITLEAVGRP